MRLRHLRLTGVALAAVVLLLGPAGVGHADESEDTGISVTIPRTDPSDKPTDESTGEPTDDPTPGPSAPGDGPGDGDPGDGGGAGGGAGGGGDGDGGGTGDGGGSADPTDPPDPAPSDDPACEPAEPAVPQEPAADGEPAGLDKDVYLAGQQVTVTADGFGKDEKIQLVLFAAPQIVETIRADGAGVVEAVLTVPSGTTSGPHALQLTGWCGDVALAELLVGSAGDASGAGGIPAWAWWAGGGVGLVGLGVGGCYVVRLMRAPGAGLPAVGDAGVTA
ncbi:hypothetical protein [Promicromonospora sp. NPDC090134]|uniref:hypothetical protein n=1 Tax=Promicromonospora sp. NPDC090134 TaxID=3364408 RepID=UPI0037F6003A